MRIRGGSAIVLSMLMCVACNRGGGDASRFESGTGWLVSKVSDDTHAAAAGDQKHVWVWNDKGGVRTVDTAGNLSGLLLADIAVKDLVPVSNHRDGLVVPKKQPGLFLVSPGANDAQCRRNLLPAGITIEDANMVDGGVWITAGTPRDGGPFVNDRKTYFFDARTQRLLGPWEGGGIIGFASAFTPHYAVSLDERVPSVQRNLNGLDHPATAGEIIATIIDNRSGALTLRIKLAGADITGEGEPNPQITEDGRYVWAAASLMKGAFRIDLEEAARAHREQRPYQPLIILADRHTAVVPLDADRVIAFPRNDDAWARNSKKEPGAMLVDVKSGRETRTPVAALAGDVVHGLDVVDPPTLLASIETPPGGASRLALISNFTDRTLLESVERNYAQVMKTAEKTKFILRGNSVSRLDVATKSAETIVAAEEATGLFPSPSLTAMPDTGDRFFWLSSRRRKPFRGVVVYDSTAGKVLNADHAFFAKEPDLPTVTPFGDGIHAIASGTGVGSMLLDRNAALPPFRLRLGNDELTATETPGEVAFDAGSTSSESSFSLAGWPKQLNDESKVDLRVACGAKEWTASGTVASLKDSNSLFGNRSPLPWHKPCRLAATFSDAYGSRLTWQWTNVRLTEPKPVYERPWFRSIALFVFLCIFVAIGASLRGGVQRWAPLAVYAGGGFAGTLTGMSSANLIDLPLLLALLAGGATIACFCGVLSPSAFRELERIEPFRSLAPLAVSVRWIRRRLYASYVRRVADDVILARQQANAEVYSPVPLRSIEARKANLDAAKHPADALLDLLSAPALDQRAHVLIESTGGRGKSALVREVIQRALARFAGDARSPLPIVCEGNGVTLFDRAKQKLGTDDGFSDELLRALLRSGEFFLVVDGLTEQHVDPAMLREQLAGYGAKCSLLLAGRPNEALRATVESSKAWLIVEPQRLDEKTLTAFLKAYGRTNDHFPEAARDACRHRDNTYLPILVRLAILPREGGAHTLAGIYDSAIHTLLDEKGISLDSAVDLCFSTYWNDGQRQLVFALAEKERKDVLEQLLGAGLLIPADLRHAGATEPRMVQFFHDTMQSYLTAVALSREEEWSDVLLRAAGEPRFVRDQSDLAAQGGSELFQMCLHVFEPQLRMRNLLIDDLQRLAKEYGGAFSRDWVVEESGVPDLAPLIEPTTAGGLALQMAIDRAAAHRELWPLGALYSSVARFLWSRIEERRKAEEASASSVA